MPNKVKQQGRIWTSSHYPGGEEQNSEEMLEVQTFEVQPAIAKVSLGLTINLGNYESARCDAGVELPAYVEELEPAFKKAWALAEDQVQIMTKDIKKR